MTPWTVGGYGGAISGTMRFSGKAQYFGRNLDGVYIPDPDREHQTDANALAKIALYMIQTDPVFAAMAKARTDLTLGEIGLRFSSRYQADTLTEVSSQEEAVQGQIDHMIARSYASTNIDAANAVSRHTFERMIETMYLATGCGIAVRVSAPGRPGADTATCWRLVDSSHVGNPLGIANGQRPAAKAANGKRIFGPPGSRISNGIELDESGARSAIWLVLPRRAEKTRPGGIQVDYHWKRIPWYDEQGFANVVHRFDPYRPGQLRGFSAFGPVLMPAVQLSATNESYAITRRIQASNPMVRKVEDVESYKAMASGMGLYGPNISMDPVQANIIHVDESLEALDLHLGGDDHKGYNESQIRLLSAAWQLPSQYLLAVVEGVSMASGRIYVDRAYRTARAWQNDHIEQVTRIIDESYIREGIAFGSISLGMDAIADAMVGEWSRPVAPSLDRSKDARTFNQRVFKNGESPSTVYRDIYGGDWSLEQVRAQHDWDDALTRNSPMGHILRKLLPEMEGKPDE